MTPPEGGAGRDAGGQDAPLLAQRLFLFYLTLAYLSLATALAAVAFRPRAFVGFFYHPRMVAVVHLLTLGWITSTMVAALYGLSRLTLRLRPRATRADVAVFCTYAVALSGMVSHLWIEEPVGMAWAAGLVLLCLAPPAARTLGAIRRARLRPATTLPLFLAFGNLALAGTLGVLLAIGRSHPVLPGFVLDNVYAHAHLAALGWVLMMIVGFATRLVPMQLPSALPRPRRIAIIAASLEGGLLLLAAGLVAGNGWHFAGATLVVLSLLSLLAVFAAMLTHRKPRPPALRGLDPGHLFLASTGIYLVATIALGVTLLFLGPGTTLLRLMPLYFVAAVLGCFSQLIFAVLDRQLPALLWLRLARRGTPPGGPPYAMRPRWLALVQLAAWNLGTAGVVVAQYRSDPVLLRASTLTLLAAVGAAVVGHALTARALTRAAPGDRRRPPRFGDSTPLPLGRPTQLRDGSVVEQPSGDPEGGNASGGVGIEPAHRRHPSGPRPERAYKRGRR